MSIRGIGCRRLACSTEIRPSNRTRPSPSPRVPGRAPRRRRARSSGRRDVVIDRHLPIAHDGHQPSLAGIDPGDVEARAHAGREPERGETTSSIPVCRKENPVDDTSSGVSPSRYSMIDRSWGAKFQSALQSRADAAEAQALGVQVLQLPELARVDCGLAAGAPAASRGRCAPPSRPPRGLGRLHDRVAPLRRWWPAASPRTRGAPARARSGRELGVGRRRRGDDHGVDVVVGSAAAATRRASPRRGRASRPRRCRSASSHRQSPRGASRAAAATLRARLAPQ